MSVIHPKRTLNQDPNRLLDPESPANEPLRAALRLYSAWQPDYCYETGLERLRAEVGHRASMTRPIQLLEEQAARDSVPPPTPLHMDADLPA